MNLVVKRPRRFPGPEGAAWSHWAQSLWALRRQGRRPPLSHCPQGCGGWFTLRGMRVHLLRCARPPVSAV